MCVFPQTTARPYAPCHLNLILTLYTDRGEVWATMCYPHSLDRSTSSAQCGSGLQICRFQCRFRDTFPCSLPENPGVTESSQRAALVGDTLFRTAGIVGLSVSPKVDRGPEEGNGHGIYVIIVLIDSCLCDIMNNLDRFRCKIDTNFDLRNQIRLRAR